jgi:hypothetical protein
VEILVSQLRQSGSFLIPGVVDWAVPGALQFADATTDRAEYGAQRLGAILEAMVRYFDPATTQLVNYSELPAATTSRVAPHFGMAQASNNSAGSAAVLVRHAKNPALNFSADSADKHREANAHTRAMAARWMQPHYEKLEALRLQQIGSTTSSHQQPHNEQAQ